jgi:hypothetical protein
MNQTPHETVLHLELRTIFRIITATAVLCAIFLPFVRGWELERQMRLLKAGGALFIVSAITAAVMFYGRYRAEQKCGHCLLKLPMAGRRTRWATTWALPVTMAMLLLLLYAISEMQPSLTMLPLATMLPLIVNLTSFALQAWWGTAIAVELCDRGVIFRGTHHCAWASLRHVRWKPTNGFLNLGCVPMEALFTVPEADRASVGEILRQKVPATVKGAADLAAIESA